MRDLYVLEFSQKRRAPVQHGIAEDVNEKVRQRNDPDVLIEKDLLDHELPELSA